MNRQFQSRHDNSAYTFMNIKKLDLDGKNFHHYHCHKLQVEGT